MDLELLIPITLFICITYTIKATVDAFVRHRIVQARGSEDMVRSLLEGEAHRRRQASLHWGSVLVALALAFGAIELTGIRDITPGAIALLLGATGLGNLAYYLLVRKLHAADGATARNSAA